MRMSVASELVLVSVVLVLGTALGVAAATLRSLGAEIGHVETRDVVLAVLPLTMAIMSAGGLLALKVARRVRQPALTLAAAAARLREGDFTTPTPKVYEPELFALALELESARTRIHENLQAMAREEARERAILAALREPILTTTTDGLIGGFNPAATALFGSPVRIYGRAIGDLLPVPEDKGGESYLWEAHLTDVTGHTVDVEVHRVRLAEGELPATDLYVIHDVSRHAELNRLREQLLYSVAHELRGPMAVLENALDVLSANYGDLTAREFGELMRMAHRTTTRLRALMEDLLSAGNIQSGRFTVRARPINLSILLQEAMELVEDSLATRNQRVEQDLGGGGIQVLADRRYARQVLSNLLANASKYSPEGEVISVRAEQIDGQMRVTVEDHGAGIPPEEQQGLFERFYRVRPGNDEPGVGLGLAIVKGIVEAHGGSVGIASRVGVGTSVWFTLHLVPNAAPTDEPEP